MTAATDTKFTFSKIDGQWAACTTEDVMLDDFQPGTPITITKRNGETKNVTIIDFIDNINGKSFFSFSDPTSRPKKHHTARRTTKKTHRCCTTCGEEEMISMFGTCLECGGHV